MRPHARATLVSLAIVVFVLAAGAEATLPGQNGRIAFVKGTTFAEVQRDGNGIFTVSSTGSGLRRVTRNRAGADFSPVWSPDGRRLAFLRGSFRTPQTDLFVIGSNGRGLRRVLRDVAGDLAWSPNGRRLLFSRTRDGGGRTDFYVVGLTGSDLRRLTRDPRDDPRLRSSPSWSPDGTLIAFYLQQSRAGAGPCGPTLGDEPSGECRASGVWLMTANGGNPHFLAAGANPDWSPDGSRILFTRGPTRSVRTIRQDGQGEALLRSSWPRGDTPVRWTPDGKQVWSSTNSGRESVISSGRASGGSIHRVRIPGFAPSWGPRP